MPREKFTEDDDDRIRKGVAEFKHHGSLRPQKFLCYSCEKFKIDPQNPKPVPVDLGGLSMPAPSLPRPPSRSESEAGMTAAEVSRKRHTLREGLPAHFGSVRFPASKRPPSKWVGVPPDDGDPAMERLCKDLLIGTWGLQAPTVLISVTGGAQDFKLKAKLELIFRRGLLKAAETTNAWIVTGGTHAGVMKLVGKTILGDEDVSLPCIGVCTMGVIRDHERMKHESVGRIFPFRMDDGVKGGSMRVDLDPNHTHFVMVDDGSEGKFGKETQVRAALEDAICNGKASNATQGLPPPAMVQLVLAGGPFTLETVFATLNKGRPVVVLPESGGAAQHIYDFVKRGQYPQGASPEYLEKAQKLLPEIKRLGEQPKGANNTNQLSFFLTAEDEENESNDFDRFILEAILSDCEKTYDAVMLAVLWGDQATIRNQLDQSQTEDKKGLARALEQSLLRRDANVARVLLEYNVEAKYVNMDRLFKELEAIENEKQGEDTEAKAEPANPVEKARTLSRQMTAHMQMSTRKVSTETLTLSTAKSFEYFVRNLDFVGYDYHIERRQELFGGGASMNMPPNWTDLMMWSALVATEESEPLVEALWTKCRNPIRSALMAARITRHKAKEASDNYHKTEADRLEECALKYERWAAGVLEEVEDRDDAVELLLAQPYKKKTRCELKRRESRRRRSWCHVLRLASH